MRQREYIQMEFDFDTPPEYDVAITAGWDGTEIESGTVRGAESARRWIAEHGAGYAGYAEPGAWTVTAEPTGVVIVDFGSHTRFGRICGPASGEARG